MCIRDSAAAVAAACYGVRAAMPLDLMPYGRNPIVFGTAADSPRLSHARFVPLLIFQQQKARGYYATVSYTHLRAHETDSYLVCRLLLEKKNG